MSGADGSIRPAFKAAAASGTASVVAALAGVARVKLYAVFLGAAGVGVISQVQGLANTLAVLGMLGMGVGISREVARARAEGDASRAAATLATARGLGLGASVGLALACMALAGPLAAWLLGDPRYALLLLLSIPALPFATSSRILSEVLNGMRDFRVNAWNGILTSLLAIAILPFLLWRFHLAGAAAALTIAAALSFAVIARLFARGHPEMPAAGLRIRPPIARTLLGIGAASLAMAAVDQAVVLAVRARLIALHGVEGNGLFQGVWGLSQYSLNIAVAFLSSYAFARLQESRDRGEIARETSQAVRMTLLMMAPLTAAIVLARTLLVELFLSREFLPAVPLFPWQAGGDLLRAAGGAVGVGVLAVAPVGAWLALGLSASLSFLAAFLLLVGRTGLLSGPQAWALSGALYLALSYAVMRRRAGLRLEPRVWGLAAASAALLGATIAIADGTPASYPWGAALLLAWGAVAVRPSEARGAWRRLRDRLRRR